MHGAFHFSEFFNRRLDFSERIVHQIHSAVAERHILPTASAKQMLNDFRILALGDSARHNTNMSKPVLVFYRLRNQVKAVQLFLWSPKLWRGFIIVRFFLVLLQRDESPAQVPELL